MVKKRDIQRLLKKGLTGREIARLVLENAIAQDHGRPATLSEAEERVLRDSLGGRPEDAIEFNAWIETYRLAYLSIQDAHIMSLEAQVMLNGIVPILLNCRLERDLRLVLLSDIPAIFTEKQYHELRSTQRERKLREIKPLAEVMEEWAWDAYPTQAADCAETETYCDGGSMLTVLSMEYPEIHRSLVNDMLELIRGQVRAVDLRREKKLRELGRAKRRAWENKSPSRDTLEARFRELLEARFADQERQTSDSAQTRLEKDLSALAQGFLSTKAARELEDWVFFRESDLYNARVPGAERWVDEFTVGLDDNLLAISCAIIQNPDPHDLDERGYYARPRLLQQWIEAGFQFNRDTVKRLQVLRDSAVYKAQGFLAVKTVLGALSDILGLRIDEDLDAWFKTMKLAVDTYNAAVKDVGADPQDRGNDISPVHSLLPGEADLFKISIESLEPDPRWVRFYRNRMARYLGEGWDRWQVSGETGGYFGLATKEALAAWDEAQNAEEEAGGTSSGEVQDE